MANFGMDCYHVTRAVGGVDWGFVLIMLIYSKRE